MSDWDDIEIDTWILDAEHRPIRVPMLTWSRWFANFGNRRVAVDSTKFFEVSTVFLGLNHNYFDKGPALLFETMIFERGRKVSEGFDGRLFSFRESVDMWRYSSWDDAEAGHKSIVRKLKKQEKEAATT